MTKLYQFFIVLLIIVIFIGLFILSEKVQAPTISAPSFVTEKSESEYITIDMSYPKEDNKYTELLTYIQKSKEDFLNDFGSITKEEADQMNIGGDRKYNFMVTTKVATSTKTVSYIIEVYTYTGGAHGGTTVATFTYDQNGKYVTLDDVFKNPYLEKVSNLARIYFYDKLGGDRESIDSGTAPLADNFSAWYLTEDKINFIFGQYSIGPYVIGIQEFPLDKKLVEDIISPLFK